MTDATAGGTGSFDFGRVIEHTFGVLGRNLPPFLLLSLLFVALPEGLTWLAMTQGLKEGALPSFAVGGVGALTSMLGSFLLQAAVIHGAAADLAGRKASFGECLRTGLTHFLPVLAIGVVTVVGVMLGLLLFIVPGIMLAVAWAVAAPVRVVERTGVFASLTRSAELTRGHRWPIFGLFIVFGILGAIISGVVGAIVGAVLGLAGGTGDNPVDAIMLIQGVSGPIGGALGMLVNCAGVAAVYHALRVAKEGVGAEALAAVFD